VATATTCAGTRNPRIRVVNAFRHGVDSSQLQQAASNQNIQRVLQRQASLGKRSSIISSSASTPAPAPAPAPEQGGVTSNGNNGNSKLTTTVTNGNGSNSKLTSTSHTETAV